MWQTCNWVMNQKASVVTNLQFWWNSSHLNGVQVTYSDHSVSPIFGQGNQNTQSISFAPQEKVTSMTLWGDGKGSRTGRIRITTDKGQTLDVGKDTSGQKAYSAGVGSGILVGMVGRSGDSMDMLGPVFLNGDIRSISIGNIHFQPDFNGTSTGISTVSVGSQHFTNPSSATGDLVWHFNGTVKRVNTTSFTQGTSTMYGVSVNCTVSAEVFGIGGNVQTGFTWQKTKMQQTTTTTSEEVGLDWGISGTLKPGDGTTAFCNAEMGVSSARYTSTVTLTLDDGTVSVYPESGTFSNVMYVKGEESHTPDVNGVPSVIEGPRST